LDRDFFIGELLYLKLEYNGWYFGGIYPTSSKGFIHRNCVTLFSEKEIRKVILHHKDFKTLEDKMKTHEDINTIKQAFSNLWKSDLSVPEIKDIFGQIGTEWKDQIKENIEKEKELKQSLNKKEEGLEKEEESKKKEEDPQEFTQNIFDIYLLEQLFLIEKKLIDCAKIIKKDAKDISIVGPNISKLIDEGNEILQVDLNVSILKRKKKGFKNEETNTSIVELYKMHWDKNKRIEESKADFKKRSISQTKKSIKKRNIFKTQQIVKKVTEYPNIPDGNLQLVLEVQSISVKVT
jgi:hypothetical protein